MKQFGFLLVVCVLAASISLQAQVPRKLSYQGLLTTSSGTPAQSGLYTLRFDLYNLPSGGTLRYTETQGNVALQQGTFSVILHP